MKNMACPKCNSLDNKVNDSRTMANGKQIRRRRECLCCGERYTTYERAVKEPDTDQQRTNAILRQGLADLLARIPE